MIDYYIKVVADIDEAAEPVSLDEAKAQSRIGVITSPATADPDDAYVTSLIPAARHAIEQHIGRQIGEQTLELGLKYWPTYYVPNSERTLLRDDYRSDRAFRIEFPRPPLIAVQSIKYTKQDGTEVTWYDATVSPVVDPQAFTVETASEPGAIFLRVNKTWPTDILGYGYPIKIRFTAGITTLPRDLKHAMLMMGAHMYEMREPVIAERSVQAIEIPMTVDYLCAPHVFEDFH